MYTFCWHELCFNMYQSDRNVCKFLWGISTVCSYFYAVCFQSMHYNGKLQNDQFLLNESHFIISIHSQCPHMWYMNPPANLCIIVLRVHNITLLCYIASRSHGGLNFPNKNITGNQPCFSPLNVICFVSFCLGLKHAFLFHGLTDLSSSATFKSVYVNEVT